MENKKEIRKNYDDSNVKTGGNSWFGYTKKDYTKAYFDADYYQAKISGPNGEYHSYPYSADINKTNLEAQAVLNLKVLKKDFPIYDAFGEFFTNTSGSKKTTDHWEDLYSSGYVKVMGYTVGSMKYTRSHKGKTKFDMNVSIPVFNKCARKSLMGSGRISLGPVGISVDAGVHQCTGLEAYFEAKYRKNAGLNPHEDYIGGGLRVTSSNGAYVEGGINILVAKAGLGGEVDPFSVKYGIGLRAHNISKLGEKEITRELANYTGAKEPEKVPVEFSAGLTGSAHVMSGSVYGYADVRSFRCKRWSCGFRWKRVFKSNLVSGNGWGVDLFIPLKEQTVLF